MSMAELPLIIPAEEREFEDYLTRGERLRQSFAVNGGKYVFYDGGSALMTYRTSQEDGGQAMFEAAVKSTKDLYEVLDRMNLDDNL
jgi:hypothetical protein